MKSTVETLSPTRVRLAVEVPFDELAPSIKAAYRKIAGQVRVPGFRPGKAPAAVIDQRVGRGPVLEQMVADAVPRFYSDAVHQNQVRILGQPEIEVTTLTDRELLAFTAEVDVRPELTVPPLDSISVTVESAEVTDADVDEQIAALRDRLAVLASVDRPVQDGDFVSIDTTATAGSAPIEDAATTGMSYEVGSGSLFDGLDAALLGMTAGAETTFTTEFNSGEHEGSSAEVSVVLRSVKEKQLPDLDDDFAESASEFTTLADLRTDIRARLTQVKAAEQGAQARDRVLSALVAGTEVPLPEALVVTEMNWRRENVTNRLTQAGLDLPGYLEEQGQTAEAFAAELRSAAEDAVRTQFILDAVADAGQIGVSDSDLTEHIIGEAGRYGVSPQTLANQVQESGNIGGLVGEVRRNKAMRTALLAATVVDEAGNAVDLTPLLGTGEPDTEADAVLDAASTAETSESDATAAAADDQGTDVTGAAEGPDAVGADGATDAAGAGIPVS